jgi:hypothetical protein
MELAEHPATMATELRKRRNAQEAGLSDSVERPAIQSTEHREVADIKVRHGAFLIV